METDEAMTERVQSIWADLSALEGNTLVVAHGGILRALLCACVIAAAVIIFSPKKNSKPS